MSNILANEPDIVRKKEPGENFRYKRVEHFQLMDDEEQYIAQLLHYSRDTKMITAQFKRQYPQYSSLEVKQRLDNYASNMEDLLTEKWIHWLVLDFLSLSLNLFMEALVPLLYLK